MTATRPTSRPRPRLVLASGVVALVVGVAIGVKMSAPDESSAPVLVWSHDLVLDEFPASGPTAPVPDLIEVTLDPATGCFVEVREPTAVVVWPPGTTRGVDEATVVSPDGREITAPTNESPDDVVRVPVRQVGDQIEHLDRCTTADATYVALVVGLDP